MTKKILSVLTAAGIGIMLAGCVQNDSVQISPSNADAITSASSVHGQDNGEAPVLVTAIGKNRSSTVSAHRVYAFLLNDSRIFCKEQTTSGIDKTTWPQDWLWKDDALTLGTTDFTPAHYLAAGNDIGNSNENMFVFTVTTSNKLVCRKQSGSSWGAWTEVAVNGTSYAVRGPVRVSQVYGTSRYLKVFAVDNSTGQIRYFNRASGSWTSSGLISGRTVPAGGNFVVLKGPQNKNVVVVNDFANSVIYQNTENTSGGWGGYQQLGRVSTFGNEHDMVMVKNWKDSIQLFVPNQVGNLWYIKQVRTSSGTVGWGNWTVVLGGMGAPFVDGSRFTVVRDNTGTTKQLLVQYLTPWGATDVTTHINTFVEPTDRSANWVSLGELPYPNQEVYPGAPGGVSYPISKTYFSSFNYPTDGRDVFCAVFHNNGLPPGLQSSPWPLWDVWQAHASSERWENLGGLYDYPPPQQ